jgi:hypothetical protein
LYSKNLYLVYLNGHCLEFLVSRHSGSLIKWYIELICSITLWLFYLENLVHFLALEIRHLIELVFVSQIMWFKTKLVLCCAKNSSEGKLVSFLIMVYTLDSHLFLDQKTWYKVCWCKQHAICSFHVSVEPNIPSATRLSIFTSIVFVSGSFIDYFITHVSLLPPPCEELTTSEPSGLLVKPPGTICTH